MIFNSRKNTFILCSLITILTLLAACGDSSTTSQNTESKRIVEGSVFGTSQKGPFKKGSKVTLFELDENLHQTGVHYETTIDNNLGKYNIDNISIQGPYAWMVVNGYYINEYTGRVSKREISLNGLVDLGDGKDININILSHLAFNRIYNLVQQGVPVAEAQKQAEAEVLQAFNFESDDTPFEKMDIFSDRDGDAKLLAISLIILHEWINKVDLKKWLINNCAMYTDNLDSCDLTDVEEFDKDDGGAVIDLMAKISYDLEKDGKWDDVAQKTSIVNTIKMAYDNNYLDIVDFNLKILGAKTVPDFRKYLQKFLEIDTTWNSCSDEELIKTDISYNKKICHNGKWMNYTGLREEGDDPIDTTGKYGTLIDERDGHVYKTLDIKLADGTTATWMASLLEYEALETTNTDIKIIPGVGRTYTFQQILNEPDSVNMFVLSDSIQEDDVIQGICPNGWHIPNYYDWDKLDKAIQFDYQSQELLVYPLYIEENNSIKIAFAGTSYNFVGARAPKILNCSNSIECGKYSLSKIGYINYPYTLRCVKD